MVKPEENKEEDHDNLAAIYYEGSGVLPKTGELNLALVEAEVDRRRLHAGLVERLDHDTAGGDLLKECVIGKDHESPMLPSSPIGDKREDLEHHRHRPVTGDGVR